MDNVLLISILLIFLSALFSNVLRQRKKDRVLKEIQGFHVTMQLKEGKEVWGEMGIYSNGLELTYSDHHENTAGEVTTSYIMYQEEYDSIWAFYRYHNELSEENQNRRKAEVHSTIHPSMFSRAKRTTRNLVNAFQDAINEALGVFLTRIKGSSHAAMISNQDQYIKKAGASALGMVANVFNPILERYINRRVVIVLEKEGKQQAFSGFLKEYSPHWISLLDCSIKRKHTININDIKRMSLQRDLDMNVKIMELNKQIKFSISLSYFGHHKLKLISLKEDSHNEPPYYQKINHTLKHDGTHTLQLDNLPARFTENIKTEYLPLNFSMVAPERQQSDEASTTNEVYQELLPKLKLAFYTERVADVYIPRSLGTLRHSGEYID